MMKKMCVFAAGVMALALGGCGVKYAYELTSPEETTVENKVETVTVLNIRYSDGRYTDYLNTCKKSYEKIHKNLEITLELVPPENYIRNINDDTVQNGKNIDLYIAPNSDLGTAYLAGLAEKNTDHDYTSVSYCQTALDACSYKDYLVGYPLAYETSFLVYNTDFMEKTDVATFAKIETFATNVDFTSEETMGIETVFRCNLSQSFCNYGFIGNGMDIGGRCGDNSGSFSVNNKNTVKLAEHYLSLIQYFSLESDVSYESCIEQFTSGRILATVVGLDAIEKIEESGINYGIAEFPDYDSRDKTAPLSVTTALVVNPYSQNKAAAAEFAKYLSFESVDRLYEATGMLSTRRGAYFSVSQLSDVYASYDKSVPKNKLLYGEQVYPMIEIALHNIVAGGDIAQELQKIDDYMKTQLK